MQALEVKDDGTVLIASADGENAANGRRIMKAEIAKFGAKTPATLHAPEDHPSFDCGLARLAVEKAICADPQLGALDHQIADTYTRLINSKDGRSADVLRFLR